MSVGMMLGGAAIGANAANKRKQGMNAIANTPGLDLAAQIAEAGTLMPQSQALESKRNTFNQAELTRLLAASIPGYEEGQSQRTGNAMSLMRGELPPDVMKAIFRRGASQSVAGGYAGSPSGQNLVARDLGRTSLDLMNLGNQQFQGIIGGTPMPQMANFSFTPSDIAGLRGSERTQKLSMQMAALGMPGAGDIWGKALQDTGSSLMSMVGGLAGGMMGGVGGK